MNDVTLCMLVSAPFRYVRDAIKTAEKHLSPREWIFSPGPLQLELNYIGRLREFINPRARVVILQGTDNRVLMAEFRFRQFDAATSRWIVNLDDDDGILGPLPFKSARIETGIIHTDILGICMEESGLYKMGDVTHRTAKTITDRREAEYFRGCYWAVRRKCWEQIRHFVDWSSLYEDWQVAYHAIRLGWEDLYVPRVLQYQRLRKFVETAEAQQASGYCWKDELEMLERKYAPKGERR